LKEDVMTTLALPTTRFTELLLATDFSNESQQALLAAKAIAGRFNAEISAVNVVQPVNPVTLPEGAWFHSAEDLPQAEDRMTQLAGELLSEGIRAKGSCVVGSVDEEILQAAREVRADLVVTGAHGRLGANRWLYGSVAEDVAKKARIPLLMVGPGVPEHAFAQGWEPKRMLCGATMDGEGEFVVRYTDALAREFDARWELACDYYDDVGEYCAWDKFRERLERVLPRNGAKLTPMRTALLSKPYGQNLAELASVWEADLLIIGHSDHLLQWSVFRSGTIPHLLAEATCPVLIVPPSV
jgi:nucleotide-binding universal stress UspA family protein